MSDYMFVLDSHLDAAQNRVLNEIQRLATDAAMTVWLTGGAMRDMLRGSPTRDLDFTVERDAIKVARSLAANLSGEVAAEDPFKRFAELVFPGELRVSVGNVRSEKYSKPGGKPHIGPATIHEDLARRDFTINAIALSLNRGSRGLLVDPVNGQADLNNRELRTTNSSAFFDDPSRIFRLIRFQHVLGFEVATRTQSQLENALLEEYQNAAVPGALAREIRAVGLDQNVVAFFETLERYGLLKTISPGLTGAKLNLAGLTKLEKIAHSVLPPGTPGGWLAFVSVLVEKLNTRERAEVLRGLELSAPEAAELKKLDTQSTKLETLLKSPKVTRPSHVWLALQEASSDEILMVLYHSAHRSVQDRIRTYYQKYLPMAQEVTEEEVAATGVKPGTPKFTKAYQAIVTARLNARPKKVVEEPEPAAPPPMAMAGARGRK